MHRRASTCAPPRAHVPARPLAPCPVLQLLLGVALPALLLANVEENSRQRFLRLRDGQPFFYSAAAQMWFSLGALPLLAAVVYQAVNLVVRPLL